MNIEVEITVYVVHIGIKQDPYNGPPVLYEYVGVAGTFVEALRKGEEYVGGTAGPMSWRSETYATAFIDPETAIFIRKATI